MALLVTELSLLYKRYNCTVLISLAMNQAGANYDIIHVLLEANKFMSWQKVNMCDMQSSIEALVTIVHAGE